MIRKYTFLALLAFTACSEIEIKESSLTENLDLTKLSISVGTCDFRSEYGYDTENKPIGGGVGYGIVSQQSAHCVVSNYIDLKSAIENAQNGSVIFINGTIDFTGRAALVIDKSVTLAGSRGDNNSCGALIKTDDYGIYDKNLGGWINNSKPSSEAILVISNTSNTRISGLQFEGPFGEEGDLSILKLKMGISIDSTENVIIDNCEFRNWPRRAVGVNNANNNIAIKNNYFHNNKQKNFGYGVAIGENAFALVKNNIFDNNRHDITCSGLQGTGYEFSFNVCGQGTHPNVDTHGQKDLASNFTPQQPVDIAGTFFYVHHNLFLGTNTANIQVRGIPEKLFMIEKNKFAHTHVANAVYHYLKKDQVYYNYDENVFAFNNSYNENYQGYFISRSYHKNQKIVDLPQNSDLISGLPTQANPFQIMNFAIGDFSGDGLNQIFISKDQQWKAIDYPEPETMHLASFRANYDWEDLAGSSIPPSHLIIGDFNGDTNTPISDALKANGSNWAISYSGNQSWQIINNSDLILTQLKFGDFNDNGTTDVFWANGSDWFLSDAATADWLDINTSNFDYSEVGTGDFNGDGKMDIFTASNGQFKYVNGGVGNWIHFAGSGIGFQSLLLYDVNNDGKTDVLRKFGNQYKVLMNGISSSWKLLDTTEYSNLLEDW